MKSYDSEMVLAFFLCSFKIVKFRGKTEILMILDRIFHDFVHRWLEKIFFQICHQKKLFYQFFRNLWRGNSKLDKISNVVNEHHRKRKILYTLIHILYHLLFVI